MVDLSLTIAAVEHRLALAERLCDDQPRTAEGRHAVSEIIRALGEELTTEYGARIILGGTTVRVRIAGIHATSTIGLAAALHNWLRTARAREALRLAREGGSNAE